jgi:hypothetical protein
VFLFLNEKLIYDNPFLIFINGDCYTANSISGVLSPFHNFNSSQASLPNPRINSSLTASTSTEADSSGINLSRNVHLNQGYYQSSSYGHGSIYCPKMYKPFHFVLNDQNMKGLSVFGNYIFFYLFTIQAKNKFKILNFNNFYYLLSRFIK